MRTALSACVAPVTGVAAEFGLPDFSFLFCSHAVKACSPALEWNL